MPGTVPSRIDLIRMVQKVAGLMGELDGVSMAE